MNKSKILFPIIICCALSPKAINSYEFKSELSKFMNETITPIVLGAACGLASSKLEARKDTVVKGGVALERVFASIVFPIVLDVFCAFGVRSVLFPWLISGEKKDRSFSSPEACFAAAYFFARVYALPVK